MPFATVKVAGYTVCIKRHCLCQNTFICIQGCQKDVSAVSQERLKVRQLKGIQEGDNSIKLYVTFNSIKEIF